MPRIRRPYSTLQYLCFSLYQCQRPSPPGPRPVRHQPSGATRWRRARLPTWRAAGPGLGRAALGPALILFLREKRSLACDSPALWLAWILFLGETRSLACDSRALGLKCYGGHTVRLLGMKAQPPKHAQKDQKTLVYGQVVIHYPRVAHMDTSHCHHNFMF